MICLLKTNILIKERCLWSSTIPAALQLLRLLCCWNGPCDLQEAASWTRLNFSELLLWEGLSPDHQTFGISTPYWNSSHWEVLKQRVLNSKLDSVTARGKFGHPLQHKLPPHPPLVKWMHTLDTVQTNLQVCQVSQECLWQVFVWNIFWRLEHFYAFFMDVHIL